MPIGDIITFKITHAPSATTRKLLIPIEAIPACDSLIQLSFNRFNLSGPAELVYKDEDGDLITLSSDEELKELVHSAQEAHTPLRFELRQTSTALPSATVVEKSQISQTVESASPVATHAAVPGVLPRQGQEVEDKNGENQAEEWTQVQADETLSTSQTASSSLEEEPTTPTLLFEDPDETPLPSTSDLACEQATKEFPPPSSSSAASSRVSSPPVSFPDDPLDLPLPSFSDETLPFANLPNSLSSFLASLGTRSSTFSSTLASALSPTSPHSPTSRLSSILSASSLDDIPLVASSLVQMGSEFAEIAKDVVIGVRREADEIRGDFSRLREEVERERSRFRDEIREAVNRASTPRGEEEDIELDQVPTSNDTPRPSAAATDNAQPPSGSNTAESVRSSTASSSVNPSNPQAPSASSPADATVSRETSRLLHKQAKQARKEYRAAVRQAREEKKRARSARSTTSESEQQHRQGGSTPEYGLPGGMPAASDGKEEKI
ncbi:PB1 domain-containing protein [Sporobolomyces salmoneus]|uniref:PB1 domain-containing protein n=1 Tax=Sporobolomyces salmoneus TaxID=183962 RepID=UPI00317EBDDA